MPSDSAFDATRRQLLGAAVGAALLPSAAVAMDEIRPASPERGFDFLHGRWSVLHRKLKQRLVGSTDWIEFAGTLDVRPFLGGSGNIDENLLHDPGGTFLATSIRVFRPASGDWSIHWVDGRSSGLDIPVIGRFDGKVGRFFCDDQLAGRPIRVRFTYEDVSPVSARWDQAFSADSGATWEKNWTMAFTREAGR